MNDGIVEKIINGGWGLVRSDDGVVLLNYVIPGEEVTYRIKEKSGGILWGELLEVQTPSEHRVEPPCPYYGQCGGCVFQHIDYAFQKTIKQEILHDDLSRIGHVHVSLPPVIDSPPYHNRIRARMKAQDDGKIGFIRKGTNSVIPINRCLLFPEAFNRFLNAWNELPAPPFFHQLDILINRDTQKVFIHLSRPPKQEKEILKRFPDITFSWKGNEDAGMSELKIKDWKYLISPAAFFQVNPFQWEKMLNTVESYLDPCNTIIDLFSGVGFFIPLLKTHARRVIGVENAPYSVTLARRAFEQDNVGFIKVSAEKFAFEDADAILVDPPRSGLAKKVIDGILRKKYPKVLFISCASATFSRDLKTLTENGYRLEDIRVFDLFPQTPHLETIALFTRN
ncbi:MAG: class I SAM-dependent RNA methyltransferase [Candidatus Omnitrophota bacterium]